MQLARYPRGEVRMRALDAPAVPRPHGNNPGTPQDVHEPAEAPRPRYERIVADSHWVGWRATDSFGRVIGRVEGTLQPDWLIVRCRRNHHALVPVAEAIAGGEAVFLPYSEEQIESAPEVAPDVPIAAEVIAAAAGHFGMLNP